MPLVPAIGPMLAPGRQLRFQERVHEDRLKQAREERAWRENMAAEEYQRSLLGNLFGGLINLGVQAAAKQVPSADAASRLAAERRKLGVDPTLQAHDVKVREAVRGVQAAQAKAAGPAALTTEQLKTAPLRRRGAATGVTGEGRAIEPTPTPGSELMTPAPPPLTSYPPPRPPRPRPEVGPVSVSPPGRREPAGVAPYEEGEFPRGGAQAALEGLKRALRGRRRAVEEDPDAGEAHQARARLKKEADQKVKEFEIKKNRDAREKKKLGWEEARRVRDSKIQVAKFISNETPTLRYDAKLKKYVIEKTPLEMYFPVAPGEGGNDSGLWTVRSAPATLEQWQKRLKGQGFEIKKNRDGKPVVRPVGTVPIVEGPKRRDVVSAKNVEKLLRPREKRARVNYFAGKKDLTPENRATLVAKTSAIANSEGTPAQKQAALQRLIGQNGTVAEMQRAYRKANPTEADEKQRDALRRQATAAANAHNKSLANKLDSHRKAQKRGRAKDISDWMRGRTKETYLSVADKRRMVMTGRFGKSNVPAEEGSARNRAIARNKEGAAFLIKAKEFRATLAGKTYGSTGGLKAIYNAVNPHTGKPYATQPFEEWLKSKGIKSMKKGGTVEETGLHLLHKGEEVIPAGGVKEQEALTLPTQIVDWANIQKQDWPASKKKRVFLHMLRQQGQLPGQTPEFYRA